jgi:hypothetical protein
LLKQPAVTAWAGTAGHNRHDMRFSWKAQEARQDSINRTCLPAK